MTGESLFEGVNIYGDTDSNINGILGNTGEL